MSYLETMYDRDRLEQLVYTRYRSVSLSLSGAVNARDMGGLPARGGKSVRRMVLFRSGELSELTPQDALILSRSCNIRLTIDLRSAAEAAQRVDKVIPGSVHRAFPFAVYSLSDPLLSPSELYHMIDEDAERAIKLIENSLPFDLKRLYISFYSDISAVNYFGKLLREVYDRKSGSMLIHGTWGKDITGASAALILLLLGVSEENVLIDYCASNAVCKELQSRLCCSDDLTEKIQHIFGTDDSMLCLFLDGIRKNYGSPEEFAKAAAGFDDTAIEELRQRYLI